MRQLRLFTFLFSLIASHQLFASPIHVDVEGTLASYADYGSSPIANGANVVGWYELDWDNAKFATTLPSGAIYTGILTYQFNIGNNLTLSGSNPNIEYHSTSENISPNSEQLEFQDQSADLAGITGLLPIEDLFFYVSNKNGVRSAWFDYYSVPDFDHDNNVYYGRSDLTTIAPRPLSAKLAFASVPEPSSLLIFILGFVGVFVARLRK